MYGNSFESCLVAIINPNKQGLEKWAESNGVSGDFASICGDSKAKEFILEQLSKTGKEKKVIVNLSVVEHTDNFINDDTCGDLSRYI